MANARRTVALPMIASLALVVLAGCGGDESDGGAPAQAPAAASGKTYTIATTIPFPPYTDLVDGEFVGLEKDLITAIGEKAGFKIKVENAPKFESLIPGMLSGRYDAAYDAFGDNPARHDKFKTVDWLGYRWSFAAEEGGATDGSQFCGKKVAVQAGSQVMIDALEEYSKATCSGTAIKQTALPIGQQASSVKSGRTDAMVTDSISLPGVLEKNSGFAQVGESYGDPVLGGLLVPAKNAAFADEVVKGLKQIVADGTYDEILGKWDVTDAQYKKATVNAGT